MLRFMLVEDEQRDMEVLRNSLRELAPEAELIECGSAEEALMLLNQEQKQDQELAPVDLFFLDWELPGENGFELAQSIREKPGYLLTPIVFVTGYEMDQLDAFQEYHCYSCMMKPCVPELVQKRIGKLLEQLKKTNSKSGFHPKKAVFLNTRDGERIVRVDQILFLEMQGKDCMVHTYGTVHTLPRVTLEGVIKDLDETAIQRCHKSFAVNLDLVTRIMKVRKGIWTPLFAEPERMKGSGTCEISIHYYSELKDKLLDRLV